MRQSVRVSIKASAIALFGFGSMSFASSASAACGELSQPASWQVEQGSGVSGLLHEAAVSRSIVGLWSFKMTPTAGPGDFGYQQWHSDGTELDEQRRPCSFDRELLHGGLDPDGLALSPQPLRAEL